MALIEDISVYSLIAKFNANNSATERHSAERRRDFTASLLQTYILCWQKFNKWLQMTGFPTPNVNVAYCFFYIKYLRHNKQKNANIHYVKLFFIYNKIYFPVGLQCST